MFLLKCVPLSERSGQSLDIVGRKERRRRVDAGCEPPVVPPRCGHPFGPNIKAPQEEINHRHAVEVWIEREVANVDYTPKRPVNVERPLPRGELPWQGVDFGEIGERPKPLRMPIGTSTSAPLSPRDAPSCDTIGHSAHSHAYSLQRGSDRRWDSAGTPWCHNRFISVAILTGALDQT